MPTEESSSQDADENATELVSGTFTSAFWATRDAAHSDDSLGSDDSDVSELSEPDSFEELDIQGTTCPQTVFNVVKNIVGEGMLSLPAGVAAGTGLFVAIIVMTCFGVLAGYTFSAIGRACHVSHEKTFKGIGEVVSGPRFAMFMAVVLMVKTAFTCVGYSIVIGDATSSIFHRLGWASASPQLSLLLIMVFILLPLVLQRDLSVLSYTSLFGVLCEITVVSFMQVRYLDGSYMPTGQFYNTTAESLRQEFVSGSANYWGIGLVTFVFVGSMSTAFIAHYNAPKFYSHMRVRTVERFNKVVPTAFAVSFAIYVWVMCVGYLTFGSSCAGDILRNYSEKDDGALVARIAISIAIIFGFPLSFTALRDSFLSVFSLSKDRNRIHYLVTIGLLIPINGIAFFIHDLGLVNSLGGSIFGSLICVIFPGLLVWYSYRKYKKEFSQKEASLNLGLVFFGFVIMCLGVAVNYQKACNPRALGFDRDGDC